MSFLKRNSVNFYIDIFSFLALVYLATTGVLIRYFLPPGSGHASTIWGLNRHAWGGVHFWIALVFLCVLGIHLFLHWRWTVRTVKGRPGEERDTVRGGTLVVGLLALVCLALSPLFSAVEYDGPDAKPFSTAVSQGNGPVEIQGFMTLGEVEESTGVPVLEILRRLHLSADLPPDERLGKLRREYGFTMEDVNKIIQECRDEKGP